MLGLNLTLLATAIRSGYGAFNPTSLFANGEQGVWYDPSDFSRYTQTGPETVSNGTFDDGVTGWVQALGSISAVGGRLRAARSADGASAGRAYNAIQCVPGKTYLFKVERYKAQTGSTTVRIGVLSNGSSVGAVQIDSSTIDGFYRTTFVATQAEHYVILESGSGTSGQYAEFDNVSVQELTALDSCTLFQDSAGTTPVTSVEQPVGLMLDKRLGAKPGPELVANGDFSSGATGWNASPGTQTSQLVGNAWRIASTDGSSAFLSQPTLNAVAGKMYRVSIDIISTTGTGVLVEFGGATSPSLTTAGTKTFYLNCTATVALVVKRGGICDATFDNISVKEIPGNHAFQTTAIDRPVLRNRYNLLTKTEQFDDAAWSKSNYLSVLPVSHINPLGGSTAHLAIPNTASSVKTIDRTDAIPASCKKTIYAKAAGYRYLQINYGVAYSSSYANFDLQTGTVTAQVGGSASIIDAGEGWWLLSFVVTGTAVTTGHGYTIVQSPTSVRGESMTGNGTSGIYIWGASLTPADQSALPYQRVNTSTDYDADPTKFPLYLAANGTNTWMKTGFIDFASAGAQLAIFAGVRKAVDTTTGMLIEHGPDASTTDGTFALAMPTAAAANSFVFLARVGGTSTSNSLANSLVAPQTAVLTCTTDGSVAVTKTRKNGATVRDVTSVTWAGVFSSRELFLFRRQGTALPFNGNFYGLVIRGALTPDSQIGSMERWLANKTGVAL